MGNMNPMASSMNQNNNSINVNNDIEDKQENRNTNNSVFSENIDRNDENMQMLKAIRSIVNGDRLAFIDKVILMYNDGVFDE